LHFVSIRSTIAENVGLSFVDPAPKAVISYPLNPRSPSEFASLAIKYYLGREAKPTRQLTMIQVAKMTVTMKAKKIQAGLLLQSSTMGGVRILEIDQNRE
jgi:hypothetical protein